jgi:glycine/D-amino acid oxidase-like deaminating enzyme
MPSVIIYGGSVIGACVDFYLAERGADITAVERAGSANGASGRSGGF